MGNPFNIISFVLLPIYVLTINYFIPNRNLSRVNSFFFPFVITGMLQNFTNLTNFIRTVTRYALILISKLY